MSEDGTITTELQGHIYTITIDRQQKMNSFTPAMFDDLSRAFATLEDNSEAWVGVVRFAGKHTTAGLDLPKFASSMRDGSRDQPAEQQQQIDAFGISRRCAKPIVMAVQGVCFTIGIEMMLGVDIVVAADNTRFCQLEPKRGLAVFGGAHVRYVQRAGWGNAMYHLLRADEFDATRALQLGFIQEVVPVGQQGDRATALAEQICECAPLAVQEIKRASTVYLQQGEQAAFEEIPEMRQKTANSQDFAEGIASFQEKRPAVFKGS